MSSRTLRLGTRRSALARAQSSAFARALERAHPGLSVELVGIDTRGDRIQQVPLSQVDGKEFFTAEIDAALRAGEVDFTVHSYKDLSLERPAVLHLACVPRRENPRDLVIFAPDVMQRLAEGATLRIGSSSPRRVALVPDFLRRALPGTEPAQVQLVELRGNVDTRLRRVLEPRGSERHLDGVILACAGLARLWRDEGGTGGGELLRGLLQGLPRMMLPLNACPTAPAQGALAVECRSDDAATQQLLGALDDGATRRAVDAERELLAERGGGCHQRFGATQIAVPGLGNLLHLRADGEQGPLPPELRWQPEQALPERPAQVHSFDGTRHAAGTLQALSAGESELLQALPEAQALFIAHRRALPESVAAAQLAGKAVWVSGVESWFALARRGVWVQGCGESLGFEFLTTLLDEAPLQLPPLPQWLVLTHRDALQGWHASRAVATYFLDANGVVDAAPPADVTHVYWSSSAQFDRWQAQLGSAVHHACGPGKTAAHLRACQVQNLAVFPGVAQWRAWLAP
ncbi:MAG: hydroxymethylbilane synthase [Steroidobacteraceae bacterium]